MARIEQGRWTADLDGDFVVFLIGFRAAPSWKIVRAREYEAIYQGMPAGFGLLGAGTPRLLGGSTRAAQRLGAQESDLPAPG